MAIMIGVAHGQDCFAKGLRIAARVINDGVINNMLDKRYATFNNGFGKRIEEGQVSLEDCEDYVKKHGEPKPASGKQELYEMVLNRYC